MTDTAFEELDQDPPRYATGYLHADGPPDTWRSNIFSLTAKGMPDGGMITTAPDLACLVDALLGGKLLSPPLLAAMTTPQTPPSTALEHYGYGLELVVLCNQDRGSWAAVKQITRELGLTDPRGVAEAQG